MQAAAPNGVTPTLKQKKSLDWLSKGFKRKGSSSSLSSAASNTAASQSSSGGSSHRDNRDRERGSLAGVTRSFASCSTASEPLLTIPGSPAVGYSPPSSSGGRSASPATSAASLGPSTPDGSTVAVGSPHSATSSASQYNSSPQVSPPAVVVKMSPSETDASARHPHPSALPSPLHSPSVAQFNGLLGPGTAARGGGSRTPSSSHDGSPTEDDAKTPMMHNEGFRDGSDYRSGHGTPSRSPSGQQASDYERLLLSLSSRKVLRTMLDDPVGLWKFGQFLASEMNAETLVFWLNAEQHRNDLKRLYSLTQRIHSLHIPSNAPLALNITSTERANIERAIRSFTRADDPFKVARDTAFTALYHDAWPRFLQWRLELLQQKLRQGGLSPPQTSFTLADPSQDRDQPLLLVSDGFLDLSGYSRTDVLMRNCRFLQGPGTSVTTIARVRQACRDGTEITELLLNYRKDGVPFWSLLRIIPLRNTNGKLKYLLGAQINVTNVLAATADLAHLLADELDPCDMPPRPPFEHDLAETQKHDTGEAMRAYLTSLDKVNADPHKKSDAERRDIANKSLLNRFSSMSPKTSSPSVSQSPHVPTPSNHSTSSTSTSNGGSLPSLGNSSLTTNQPRPRSANRDMHLHAAAALAFDGTSGGAATSTSASSSSSSPAFGGRQYTWTGIPASARPTTSGSLFQRPGTAYSMMDNEGKAQAQLSLSEQTKAFIESSSHYMVLDSTASTVLFHSANLPAGIGIGTDFTKLVGTKVTKRIKEQMKAGERVDIDSVSFDIGHHADPSGTWRSGVRVCLTPLKDQIGEVGAVVILIQSPTSPAQASSSSTSSA